MVNFTLFRAHWLRLAHLLVLAGLATPAAQAQTGPADLTAAWLGTIDQTALTVSGLPTNGYVAQLLSGSRAVGGATVRVVNSSGVPVARNTVLTAGLRIRVTDAGGTQKNYAIQPTGAALPVEPFNNAASTTQTAITNRILSISGNSELRVTRANPLPGTMIDMQGDNVWLYFEGIKPSKFRARVLPQVTINGQRAQIDTTVRLVQYLQGCVLISQPSTFQPLQAYTGTNLTGSAMPFNLYTYYKAANLGTFNDAIVSFRLRKGYMATFATNEVGTGASKVYIAANADLQVNLPANLQAQASLVRVLPWRWVAKKGWCGGVAQGDSLYAQWNYNWNNNGQSTLDQEYVPIRQNGGWPAFSITNAKKNVTHLLGFNEPNSSQQANMSPQQALLAWPGLLQSGLRVGSPAPTDGGASWLYSFMDKADSAGYRVDYVALHFYRGCQTAAQFYSFMNAIYRRTKRPIWVTEWNNGANWTTSTNCPKPTYAEQAARIQSFITMLDTARFVERYSIYQWVEDTRKMYVTDSDLTSLTPAGIVYRNKRSPMAFNPSLQPPVTSALVSVPFNPGNLVLTRYGSSTWTGGVTNTVPVSVDEVVPVSGPLYTAGQLVRSIAIPTANSGANFGYVGSSVRDNADGAIGISPDRTQMAISGFNLSPNTANANGGTAARVAAILDADGNLDTRTGFSDGGGRPMRTATVTDSATVYIAYGANSLGLKHASLPATLTSTPQARTGTTIFPTISLKKMAVYENDLYFTQTTNGNAKVMKMNGMPGSAATPAGLPGLPVMATGVLQPSGFVMFDVNPDVPGFDLLYYTDDNATLTNPSTLNKYTFDGTTWTLRGTYSIPTTAVPTATGGTTTIADKLLRDLTGTLVRGIPTLYAVSLTSLVRLEDRAVRYTLTTTNFTAAPSITLTSLLNAQAAGATNYSYRGVAFAPGTRDSLYVRVPQTISFAALPDRQMGDPDFTTNAATTSGLELGYATSDQSVATVNNGLISIVGPGTVTITVTQPGDFKYLGASSVARTFTVDPASPLPVQLARFEATRQGEVALLSWTTASELKNKGFEVQASADGEQFRTLSFVAGAGSSASARSYQYRDQETGKGGLRYYRLRQLDLDGTATFSPVRSVQFGRTASALTAAPNPYSRELTLHLLLTEASAPARLWLTDALGRTVLEQAAPALPAGQSQLALPGAAGLLPGVYVLHLGTQHLKVVKE